MFKYPTLRRYNHPPFLNLSMYSNFIVSEPASLC
jgi:hypothetical protein